MTGSAWPQEAAKDSVSSAARSHLAVKAGPEKTLFGGSLGHVFAQNRAGSALQPSCELSFPPVMQIPARAGLSLDLKRVPNSSMWSVVV